MIKFTSKVLLLVSALSLANAAPAANMSGLLGLFGSGSTPACNSISGGIGLPICSIKAVLDSIDNNMLVSNTATAVKIIFLKEQKTALNLQTTYRMVIQLVRSYTSSGAAVVATSSTAAKNATEYIAIEGVYKSIAGTGIGGSFDVTLQYMDSDLDAIKSVLGESNFTKDSYVGCGDLKAKYASNSTSGIEGDDNQFDNVAQGAVDANGNANPGVIAQVIKLLQNRK